MNLVEELCDRIVLIDHGRVVLYGAIGAIKEQFAPQAVRLRTTVRLDEVAGADVVERHGDTYLLNLRGADAQTVLEELVARDIPLQLFEVASAPLEDIFLAAVKEERPADA
jgi:ABC-2 type transport system ATP-binding protein